MDKTQFIVDRIENGIAVCEAGETMVDIPLAIIDGDVREGDILYAEGERYAVAKEETEQRRTAINERFARLKARPR
jgi:hypothetical protein